MVDFCNINSLAFPAGRNWVKEILYLVIHGADVEKSRNTPWAERVVIADGKLDGIDIT